MKILIALVCTFFGLQISHAQEFHYWNAQVGAKPSMLGGAVTASTPPGRSMDQYAILGICITAKIDTGQLYGLFPTKETGKSVRLR